VGLGYFVIQSQKVSMPQDWADYLNNRLEEDRKESVQSVSVFVE